MQIVPFEKEKLYEKRRKGFCNKKKYGTIYACVEEKPE